MRHLEGLGLDDDDDVERQDVRRGAGDLREVPRDGHRRDGPRVRSGEPGEARRVPGRAGVSRAREVREPRVAHAERGARAEPPDGIDGIDPGRAAATPDPAGMGENEMVTLTPGAGLALNQMRKENDLPETAALRIGITTEGCEGSGTKFRYFMDFDAEPAKPADHVFESAGFRILVDGQ